MKKLLVGLVVLSLMATATSCSTILGALNQSSESNSSAASEEGNNILDALSGLGGDSAEAEEIMKYNSYIDLQNYIEGDFYTNIDNYFTDFEFVETFTKPAEPISAPIYPIDETDMDEAADYATKAPEYAAADAAVLEMKKLFVDIAKLSNEINTYYEAKSYMDDDYAKAAQWHTELFQKVTAFDAEYLKFDEAFSAITDASHEEQKKDAEKEGKLITLYSLNMIDDVSAIYNEIDAQGITDANIIDLNLETLKPLYDKLVADYTELQANLNDEAMIEKEGFGTDNVSNKIGLDAFKSSSTELKAAFSSLIERVEKKEALSETELQLAESFGLTSPEGSLGNISYTYGEFIDDYNQMVG